jgi:chromosome segregation protein
MYLKTLEIAGFKSFAKKVKLDFNTSISAIVGPNGSGKSNIAESLRFVLGEQSIKSMRGKRGEDLIFNGTNAAPKQNRASVKVIFDNSDKTLPLDFEQVSIERVVNRDGSNEYLINNSQVRLKDITELLASANIGSSGHHIISQGEADRILNTSIKERREMLEDALGLRVYQYKKLESQRKLDKTQENIKQVESLRREIAPHIKFLKKQVEKIEEAKALKEKLKAVYQNYLKRESIYLENKQKEIDSKISSPKENLAQIEKEIQSLSLESNNMTRNVLVEEIKQAEKDTNDLNVQKNDLLRQIGRIEGEVESLKKVFERSKHVNLSDSITIPRTELENLKSEISTYSIHDLDFENVKILFNKLIDKVILFLNQKTKDNVSDQDFSIEDELQTLTHKKQEINYKIQEISASEIALKNKLQDLRIKLDNDKNSTLEVERKIISLMREKNELQNLISEYAIQSDVLERDILAFKQELTEAAVLVGREILNYENIIPQENVLNEERSVQIDLRRNLEKMKIKVEEMGAGGGEDIIKEFNETCERDLFLIKEIEDLQKSLELLNQLILDLEEQINIQFKEGLDKINTEFQKFFELMFGGGTANLKLIKIIKNKKSDFELDFNQEQDLNIPEESEEGIEINVNLPRKKIKSLMMLSGGERALTSIALLFAISQVNPPPFIILDETDAALDEANSRKYGDMIENLSKYSQLILITHNRETMSRAGALYGVTMMTGMSQLLTINFDDGIQWAK